MENLLDTAPESTAYQANIWATALPEVFGPNAIVVTSDTIDCECGDEATHKLSDGSNVCYECFMQAPRVETVSFGEQYGKGF